MKIAMFGHKRIPSREGGVEIVVEELAKREAALGNEITVYNRLGHHVSGSKFDSQIKSDDLKNIKIKTVFTFENSGSCRLLKNYAAMQSNRAAGEREGAKAPLVIRLIAIKNA